MNKFTWIGIVILVCGVPFVTSVVNQESKSAGPDPNDEEQPEGSGKNGENTKRHLRFLYGDAYNDYFEEDMLGPYTKSFWNKYHDYLPQQLYLNPSYDTFKVPLDHYVPCNNPTSHCEDENVIMVNPKSQLPKKPLKDILRLDETLPYQEPKPSKKPSSSQKNGSEYRDNLLKHVLKIVNYVQDKQTKEYNKKPSKKSKNKTKSEKCNLPCIGVNIDGKTVSKIPPTGLVPLPCEEDTHRSSEYREKTCNDLNKVLEIAQNCKEEQPYEDEKPIPPQIDYNPKPEPYNPPTAPPPVAHQQPQQQVSSPKVLIEKLVLVNGQLPTQQPMNHITNDLYNSIMTIINSYTQNGMPQGNQGGPGGNKGGNSGGVISGLSGTVGNLVTDLNGVVTGQGSGGHHGNSGGLLKDVEGTVGDLLRDVNGLVTGEGGKGGNSGSPGGNKGGDSGGVISGLSGTVGNLVTGLNGVVTGQGNGGHRGNSGGLLKEVEGTLGDLLRDVNGLVTGEGGKGGKGGNSDSPGGNKGGDSGGVISGLSGTVGNLVTGLNGVVTGQGSGGHHGNSGGLLKDVEGTVGDLLRDVNGLVTGEDGKGGKGGNSGRTGGNKGGDSGGVISGLSGTVGNLVTGLNGVVTGQGSGGHHGNSGGLLKDVEGTVGDLLRDVNGLVTGEGGKGGNSGSPGGNKGGDSGGVISGLSGTVGNLVTGLNGVVTGQGSGGHRGNSGGLLKEVEGTLGDLLRDVNGLVTGEDGKGGKGGNSGRPGGNKGGDSGGVIPGLSGTVGNLVTGLNNVVTGQGSGGHHGSSGGLLDDVSGTVGDLLRDVNGLVTGEGGKGGKGGNSGSPGGNKGGDSGGVISGLSGTVGNLVTGLNNVVTGQGSGGHHGSSGGLLDDVSGTVGDLLRDVNGLVTGEGGKGGEDEDKGKSSNGGLLLGVSGIVGNLLDNVDEVLTGDEEKPASRGGLLPGLSGAVGGLVNNVNVLLTGDNGGKEHSGKNTGKYMPKSSDGLVPNLSNTVGGLLGNVNSLLTGDDKKSGKGGGGGLLGLTSELMPKTIEKPPQEQILNDLNNSAYSPIKNIQPEINNPANPPVDIIQPTIDSNIQGVYPSNIEGTNIGPEKDISQISDITVEKNNEIQRTEEDVNFFAEQSEVVSHLSKNVTDAEPIPALISNTDHFADADTMVKPIVNGDRNTSDSDIPLLTSNTDNFANSETVAEPITNAAQSIANVLPIPTSIKNTDNFAGASTIVNPIVNGDQNMGDSNISALTSNTNHFANSETVTESIINEDKKIDDVQSIPASISNTDNFANAETMVEPIVNADQIIDNAQPIPAPIKNIDTPVLSLTKEIPLENSQQIDHTIEEENPLLNPQPIGPEVEGIPLQNSEPIELVQDIPIDTAASAIEGILIQNPISETIGISAGKDEGNSKEETDVPDDMLPPLPPPIPETDNIDQFGRPEIVNTEMENMLPEETRHGFPAGLAIRDLQIEQVHYAPTQLQNDDEVREEKLQKYLESSNLKMVDTKNIAEEKITFQDTQILIDDESDGYVKQQPRDKPNEVCPFEEYGKQFRCNSISQIASKTGEMVQSKHMAASDINVRESQLPGDVVMLPPATTENKKTDNLAPSLDDQNQGYQNIGDLARSDTNKFDFAMMQPFDRSNTIPKTMPSPAVGPLFDDILHPAKYTSKTIIDTLAMAPNTESVVKDKEPIHASSLLNILLPKSGEKVLNNEKDEDASASQKIEEAMLPSNAVLNNLLPPQAEINTSSRDLLSDSSLLDVVMLGAELASPLSSAPVSNMKAPLTGNPSAPAPLPNVETPISGLNPVIPSPLPNAKGSLPELNPLGEESRISGTLQKFDDGTEVVKNMLPSTKLELEKDPLMKKPQHFYPQKIEQNIPELVKSKNINSIPLISPLPSSPTLTPAPSVLSEISSPSMPTMLPKDLPKSEPIDEPQDISAPEPVNLPDDIPMNDESVPNLVGAQETRLRYNSIPAPEDARRIEKTKPTDGTLSQTDIWEAFLAGFSHGRITHKIAHTEPYDSSSHSSEELEPHSSNVETKTWLKNENSPVTPSAIANKKHSLTRRSTDNDVESRMNEMYSPWNWKNSIDESKSSTNVDINQRINDIFHPQQGVKNTEDEDYDYPIASFENMPYSQEDEDKKVSKSDESVITPDDEIPENILKTSMQNRQTAIKNNDNGKKSKTIKATIKKDPIVDYVKAYPKLKNMKKPKQTYMRRNMLVDDVEPTVLGVYQENSEECTKYYRRKMAKFLDNPPNFLQSVEDKENV